MEFRLLGPLEVHRHGRLVAVGGRKQRSLLALLLLHANEVVSNDRLIDELWGEQAPPTAAKALQVYVSQLRKALETGGGPDGGASERVLVTRPAGYMIRLDDDQFDLHRFDRLRAEAAAALAECNPTVASTKLREALALWRGAALADFAYEPFAQAEISRLEELRLTALEDRVDADLELSRHAELVGELRALVAADPMRERLRRQMMLALYRCGRQAEALEVYRKTRAALVEELGIEPGHEIRELHEAILRQDPRLELLTAAAPRPRQETKTSLPAPASPLIGRQAEVRAVRELLLGEARLVTVTGAGGSGKTRLSLELAASLVREFAHRIYFVRLAPLRRAELLTTAISSAVGVEPAAGGQPLDALKRALQVQPSLLVLDNFEHLTESAPVLAELLADSPQLTVLVTSRVSLHLSGEHEYPLDPLPLQDAIALFTERARAVRPEFEADEPVVGAICARLDCLPLALELAAARSRLLSSKELLRRLEHRLELLTGGPRDVASRQQTLRATIEWSYELLDIDEQQLFARLAVFTGGCTLEAAEQVCGASLEQMESLMDKNLLRRSETGAEVRFWMLETIREYALERLAAAAGVEEACRPYADYYLALARERVAEHDHGQHAALDELELELDNIRTALAWSPQAESVPAPVDDSACDHLPGLAIPGLVLDSSRGRVKLAELGAERLVLYVYPGTTRPGQPTLPGLNQIPGGLGCTPQALAFRDHAAELGALGACVAGLSVQTPEDQLEFADTNHVPFPVIADPERHLEAALHLPTFEVAGVTLYRRVTLIAERGLIVKVFYPVFPPERNANEVIAWLSGRQAQQPLAPEPSRRDAVARVVEPPPSSTHRSE